ncbi:MULTISPECIES: hypothetical protein [Synechocystis]|uniref:Uncharacterized protein n=1 Tax=Synechocystis salina LEGE 00031 TaxID=1828736 RepID=A0ABR9VVS2_9SYNC|nr:MULTISPECIES: hypothetical protein [Synechocystis]MBD2653715.1 hypothetical protein [Synechocystis sp. FACHB-383]MBE9195168.1 hypothetical protein [Synechocystis sp. LEGE 06083]MBE9242355.1 hypothetical protein [Synechocystis salina LEGE 00041]MBE9255451.1 hypothetical protein [Synechocystis salina LEGE 00031]QUS61615.1 hypothetical protein HTZ78_13750 [Synechocystis sp. PCC 7338]
MFDRPNKDLISAGLVSALGAGIVTSFAVNQGQDPLVALMITAIASVCGMVCHQFDLI